MSPKTPALRGLRGAITVSQNSKAEILKQTEELLRKMLSANKITAADVASVIFSATAELNAEFPAAAARKLGMQYTPLLCTREIDVPGSMPKCIRILMHAYSTKSQKEMVHVYLEKAKKLRPDIKNVGRNP